MSRFTKTSKAEQEKNGRQKNSRDEMVQQFRALMPQLQLQFFSSQKIPKNLAFFQRLLKAGVLGEALIHDPWPTFHVL